VYVALEGLSLVLYCLSLGAFVSYLSTRPVNRINTGLIIGDKLINNNLM
jgi:hypothetical protein